MKISKKFLFIAFLFTLGVIGLYLITAFKYLTGEDSSNTTLMNIVFFICQVVFLSITVLYILVKFTKMSKLVLSLTIIITVIILVGIYLLAYKDVWHFPIISSILIIAGALTSGTTVLLVKEFFDYKKGRLVNEESI